MKTKVWVHFEWLKSDLSLVFTACLKQCVASRKSAALDWEPCSQGQGGASKAFSYQAGIFILKLCTEIKMMYIIMGSCLRREKMFRRPYFLWAKYAGIIGSSQQISLPIKLVSRYPTLGINHKACLNNGVKDTARVPKQSKTKHETGCDEDVADVRLQKGNYGSICVLVILASFFLQIMEVRTLK